MFVAEKVLLHLVISLTVKADIGRQSLMRCSGIHSWPPLLVVLKEIRRELSIFDAFLHLGNIGITKQCRLQSCAYFIVYTKCTVCSLPGILFLAWFLLRLRRALVILSMVLWYVISCPFPSVKGVSIKLLWKLAQGRVIISHCFTQIWLQWNLSVTTT